MKIFSYCMAMPDDIDTLPDALDSLASFSDKIYLIDGGMTQGTLCHHPRFTEPIAHWMTERREASWINSYDDINLTCKWSGVPLTLWVNPFLDPGSQRNWIIKKMESEPEQPDWVCWIDSDEVYSDQFISGIRGFLGELPREVTNIVPQWLNLIVDEQHMAGGNHSSWLAHGRLYRPHTVYWNAGWHEHQYYEGKRVQFDTRVIHTRGLYRRRLLVQRGHPRVSGKDNPLWGDVVAPDLIPAGITWKHEDVPNGVSEYRRPSRQTAEPDTLLGRHFAAPRSKRPETWPPDPALPSRFPGPIDRPRNPEVRLPGFAGTTPCRLCEKA